MLNVAVDNFDKAADHVLELCLDKWMIKKGQFYEFWHDGRMSGVKNQTVINFVKEKTLNLVVNEKIYLGRIPSNQSILWSDCRELVSRILLYSTIRKKLKDNNKRNKIARHMK